MEFKSISYAITVCDEAEELKRLISFLGDAIRNCNEIVVQMDSSSVTQAVIDQVFISSLDFNQTPYAETPNFKILEFPLDNDFSSFKNNLKLNCAGDFIFQIDADEMPSSLLIENIPRILQKYPDAGLIHVPRANTVEGITEDHIKKWNWNVNNNNLINWPDWQPRIFKNTPSARWHLAVHETIVGYEGPLLSLPQLQGYALHHHKTIDRQEKQNNLYEKISQQ